MSKQSYTTVHAAVMEYRLKPTVRELAIFRRKGGSLDEIVSKRKERCLQIVRDNWSTLSEKQQDKIMKLAMDQQSAIMEAVA